MLQYFLRIITYNLTLSLSTSYFNSFIIILTNNFSIDSFFPCNFGFRRLYFSFTCTSPIFFECHVLSFAAFWYPVFSMWLEIKLLPKIKSRESKYCVAKNFTYCPLWLHKITFIWKLYKWIFSVSKKLKRRYTCVLDKCMFRRHDINIIS